MRAGDAAGSAELDFLQTGPQSWDIEVDTDAGTLKLHEGGSRLQLPGEEALPGENREYAGLYARFADLIAGGRSFGGRMTSQAQALSPLPGVRGLAFLGFPLHPAGKPSSDRAKHLTDVKIPMLFLQGTRDALACALLDGLSFLHVVRSCVLGRAHAFHALYEDTIARHSKPPKRGRFTPVEAGWAAVCYALVRHPEFHFY